jgi:Na+/H+-dicarboxylate symporter
MASCLAAALFFLISPGNLPAEVISGGAGKVEDSVKGISYGDQIISVVPDNIVRPFLDSNVLAILLLAFAIGLGLAWLPESEPKKTVMNLFQGLQDLLFLLIKALVWTLPLGIMAFSAQLSAQITSGGVVASSIGKYVLVILGGNFGQALVVLPIFLLLRGINPLKVISKMYPAVLMALFTKSSVATLPVTMDCAEQRLKIQPNVSRFVLPICTTINMNGCAAFILATSLFVMQNGGFDLSAGTVILMILVSVIAAVGNAGVPMGCFFLTFSLMAGIGAPVAVMGAILPVYTILDMFETAENVWSDSCVCAMTDKDVR